MIVKKSYEDQDACADANLETWFASVKDADVVMFATEIQLARLRVGHERGEIQIEYIEYEDRILDQTTRIGITNDGMLTSWPKGFSDVYDNLLSEMCGWGRK